MINKIFERMDAWRNLPNYQLERRADLFFSLYLPEVLQKKLRFEISPVIIPEFPVRIGTIYPHIDIDKSYKVDYVCFSADMQTVIFVELKTEELSRRESQDKYLAASCKVGFASLLEGVIKIFQATAAKRKYFYLLNMLAQAGLLEIPTDMYTLIRKDSLQGISAAAENIKILECPQQSTVIYIQPNGEGSDIISFHEFKSAVEQFSDPVSQRFTRSLDEWATVKAGHRFD